MRESLRKHPIDYYEAKVPKTHRPYPAIVPYHGCIPREVTHDRTAFTERELDAIAPLQRDDVKLLARLQQVPPDVERRVAARIAAGHHLKRRQ